MKIAIASSCYPPEIRGGAEHSTKQLAEALVKAGLEVVSISFSNQNSEEIINGVKVIRLKPTKGNSLYYNDKVTIIDKISWRIREEFSDLLAMQVIEEVKKHNVTKLITSTIEDVSCYVWKLAKENQIETFNILRSYYVMCLRGSLYKKEKSCQGICLECQLLNRNKKKMSQYVDHIIGISDFVLHEHINSGYFIKAKSTTIGNICFNSEMFAEFKKKNHERLKTESITLGYLGRIHNTKGIDHIIDAAISSTQKNILIKIAGTGDESYIDSLKLRAANLGSRLEFIGHVEPFEFLNSIDALVVPSIWKEPFGRIVMESYITKTPVIAANSGGLIELVNSKTGWLYENKSELTFIFDHLTISQLSDFDFNIINEFTPNAICQKWLRILS